MAGRFSLPICPVLSLAFAAAAAAAAAQAPASPVPPPPAVAPPMASAPPTPAAPWQQPTPTAHAAAVQAAATQADPQSAANAYAALYAHGACDRDRTMRGLGYRSCAAAGYLHVEPRRGNVYDRMARAGGDGGALPTPDAPPAGGHTSLERTGNAAPPPARTAGPRRRHGRRCGIVSRFVSIETTARAS